MRKSLRLSLGFIMVAFSVTVFAHQTPTIATIAECAKLIPSDSKAYDVSITGTISADREFHGELNVTDNSRKSLTPAEKEKIAPFIDCMKKQMK